jgi:hypothetical protein
VRIDAHKMAPLLKPSQVVRRDPKFISPPKKPTVKCNTKPIITNYPQLKPTQIELISKTEAQIKKIDSTQ